MRAIEGKTDTTQLVWLLAGMRADYVDNVKKGHCAMNRKVLREFDEQVRKLRKKK